MTKKLPVLHEKVAGGCGDIAFYSLVPLLDYDRIPSSAADDIEQLDGSHPPAGKILCCGSCGEVWSQVLRDSHFIIPSNT